MMKFFLVDLEIPEGQVFWGSDTSWVVRAPDAETAIAFVRKPNSPEYIYTAEEIPLDGPVEEILAYNVGS
jgi:hypothetical protein